MFSVCFIVRFKTVNKIINKKIFFYVKYQLFKKIEILNNLSKLTNQLVIRQLHNYTIIHNKNKTMLKNIKDIRIDSSDISDISCFKHVYTLHISNLHIMININKLKNVHTLKIISDWSFHCNINKLKNIHTIISNIKIYTDAILNNCNLIFCDLFVDSKKIVL